MGEGGGGVGGLYTLGIVCEKEGVRKGRLDFYYVDPLLVCMLSVFHICYDLKKKHHNYI